MKSATIDGIEYYTRPHPHGYGYEIMKIVPREDKPDKQKKITEEGRKRLKELQKRFDYFSLFRSKDKELVMKTFKKFLNISFGKGEVVTDFPDVSNETYPEKILVLHLKYGHYYYSVPTYESLIKTIKYVLKDEYKDEYKHMKPENTVHNDSGVTCQEEIDSIPKNLEKLRVQVQGDWEKYQKKVKENKEYIWQWKNLCRIIEKGKGDVFEAMSYFMDDKYFYEDLTTIEDEE